MPGCCGLARRGRSDHPVGSDACYFNGSAYLPLTGVTGGTWIIGGITLGARVSQIVTSRHNQWGPDIGRYFSGPVQYYQQSRARLELGMLCGFSARHTLTINLGSRPNLGDLQSLHPITSTIDATGITNCRPGVCAPIPTTNEGSMKTLLAILFPAFADRSCVQPNQTKHLPGSSRGFE